ncbi:MAG TPA: DivIVA domain-containing protein [Gemmatimonadales bacterium]|nr:DivIVA domain-containing protein [Gemmatimonadales bacterium]
MNDSVFRLTPQDLRTQQFGRALRGYDRGEVDEILRRAADELETLLRTQLKLDERLRAMQEQLQSFQERERAMNEALVAAQQLRTDSRTAAERDAEAVLERARGEAALLLERAQGEERIVRERTAQAHVQFAAYVAGLRGMLERQLAELAGLEAQVER